VSNISCNELLFSLLFDVILFSNSFYVPATETEWEEIQTQFMTQWNFSHCCEAIYGKHIKIQFHAEVVQNCITTKGPIVFYFLLWSMVTFFFFDVLTLEGMEEPAIAPYSMNPPRICQWKTTN
jgi:hypothetical protein